MSSYEALVCFGSSMTYEEIMCKINNIIQDLKGKYNFEYEEYTDIECKRKFKYNFNRIVVRNEFLEKVIKTKGFSAERGKDDLEEKVKEPVKQVISIDGFNKK